MDQLHAGVASVIGEIKECGGDAGAMKDSRMV